MKRYTPEELAEVLRLHRLWVEGEEGGARADLSCADLSGANLSRSNLSRANLSRTNLCDAVLCGSNLAHANLAHANLDGADLSRTNLYCADLSRASLRGANLSRTNLCDAIGYVPFVEVGPIGSRNDRTRFTPSSENVVCYCDVPCPGGEAVSEWHGINCPFCGQLHAGLPCPSVKGSREVWYPVHHYHGGGEWENAHTAPIGLVTDEQAEILSLRAKLQAAEAMVATAHPPKMIRDLVSKLQAAEAENARLHAEVARLREALELIACNKWTSSPVESMQAIARAALEVKP